MVVGLAVSDRHKTMLRIRAPNLQMPVIDCTEIMPFDDRFTYNFVGSCYLKIALHWHLGLQIAHFVFENSGDMQKTKIFDVANTVGYAS